jgi:flagellar protein FliJ
MEGRTAYLKRRIPLMRQLIVECDGAAAKLDQEVRTEEDRVKEHDPAAVTYSTYAKATASRRDNLRRSAEELRAHLVKAEKALRELGEDS